MERILVDYTLKDIRGHGLLLAIKFPPGAIELRDRFAQALVPALKKICKESELEHVSGLEGEFAAILRASPRLGDVDELVRNIGATMRVKLEDREYANVGEVLGTVFHWFGEPSVEDILDAWETSIAERPQGI